LSGDTLVSWVCKNSSCSIKQFKNIVKFVSKEAMDIYGVSESVIEKLLSMGYINNIADLYKVTETQLLTLDSFGERSAEKFLKAVEASKKNFMHQFLAGAGIPNLAKTASRIFSENFDSLDSFRKASKSKLESISGIGSELSETIIDYFKIDSNNYLFQWFIDNDICNKPEPSKIKSDKLKDIVLIMTGSCDSLGRGQFKDLVVENGGKVASGITSKVHYVIVGDGAGPSKMKKITDLQSKGSEIKTINEHDFLKMI